MVTARQSFALIVCLIYVPHITSAFFRKSNLQKRGGGGRNQDLPIVNRVFFKGSLEPELLASRYGSVVLECEAGGSPAPNVYWTKDGVVIPQGSGPSISIEDVLLEDQSTSGGLPSLQLGSTRSKLYIDCLTEANEGKYTCFAENSFASKSQSTFLRVESGNVLHSDVHECHGRKSHRSEPARIYLWTVSMLEYENNEVKLVCRAEGHPKPSITWYDRDNNPIQNDDNYLVTGNGDLIIKEISWMQHMGVFTCVADNGIGSDSAQPFLYPSARESKSPE